MPRAAPIDAIHPDSRHERDVTHFIAPPYDVLDADSKAALIEAGGTNIVEVDLPHLPPKTVGPDETYEQAGTHFRRWQSEGVLRRGERPALFAYRQTFDGVDHQRVQRLGLFVNLRLQPFGPGADGYGGIFQHEQTFAAPKEDRLKLMRATRAQLSPIFGFFDDPEGAIGTMIDRATAAPPTMCGHTSGDGVLHEVWRIDAAQAVAALVDALGPRDVFIADGHHRYTTALDYRRGLGDDLDPGHPANQCLFVLVAMQDPGMIVRPTHRVVAGVATDSAADVVRRCGGGIRLRAFPRHGGESTLTALERLERALPSAGPHAIGLVLPADPRQPLAVLTTAGEDPLAGRFADRPDSWRTLDVVLLQHLIVEPLVTEDATGHHWSFPHTLDRLARDVDDGDFQMGLIMQPTPLERVRQVSEAGDVMPQKSTFFYPKLATGLVIHPLGD